MFYARNLGVQSLTPLNLLQMRVKLQVLSKPVPLVFLEEKENLLKDTFENIYNINFRSSIAHCNRAFLFLTKLTQPIIQYEKSNRVSRLLSFRNG